MRLTRRPQAGHQVLGGAVGQAQEHQVEAGGTLGVDRLEAQVRVGAGQAGVELGHGRSRLGVAGGELDPELGVGRAEAQQLGPGEAGGADDPYGEHGRDSIRRAA